MLLSINFNSPPKRDSLTKKDKIAFVAELHKIEGLGIKNKFNTRKIKEIADKESYLEALQKGKTKEQRNENYQDPAIKRLQKDVEKTLRKIENSRK